MHPELLRIDRSVFRKTTAEKEIAKAEISKFRKASKVSLIESQTDIIRQLLNSETPNWGSIILKQSKIAA